MTLAGRDTTGPDRDEDSTVIGLASIRDRTAAVRWRPGRVDGDPELARRVVRVCGGTPDTATEFLNALRTIGGRVAGDDELDAASWNGDHR